MPVPSLLQLCTATAIRNVKCTCILAKYGLHRACVLTALHRADLNDIGSIPYALARPFLLKIESPERLVSGLELLRLNMEQLLTR